MPSAVTDLTGTTIKQVAIDLAGVTGTTGNGQTDLVSLAGSAGNNTITTKLTAGAVSVSGLPTQVTIAHADGDRLAIDGGDGDDSINVSAVPTKIIEQYGLMGGTGNDTITGSAGADEISGGIGNDTIAGRGGGDGTTWARATTWSCGPTATAATSSPAAPTSTRCA